MVFHPEINPDHAGAHHRVATEHGIIQVVLLILKSIDKKSPEAGFSFFCEPWSY